MTLLTRLAVFTVWLIASVALYLYLRRRNAHPKSVCVLVLGDFGRSPRMMYHAQSLLQAGYIVYLVGYAGTPILDSLSSSPNLVLVHVRQPPRWINSLPRSLFLVLAPFKLLFGASSLLVALLFQLPTFPKALLMQTPPALPTLPIVQLAVRIQGSKLIIDWHNTAFSILAMRLGAKSPFTRLAESLEAFFGRHAYGHLFVTEAMKISLSSSFRLRGSSLLTLHDLPQSTASPLNSSEAHSLFSRIPILRDPALASLVSLDYSSSYSSESTTLFTRSTTHYSADLRQDRPALLVSSTSWTDDEDFTTLLEALDIYEARKDAQGNRNELPKLVVLITGKGAGKEEFVKQVKKREKGWKYVRCRTAWLESGDYPKLLGAADLGISLHSSSSGLDLPMKIVDMFGSGLPVLALNFACIGELVQDNVNGRIFHSSSGLAQQLQDTLSGFPNNSRNLEALRTGVQRSSGRKWEQEWEEVVRPLVQGAVYS